MPPRVEDEGCYWVEVRVPLSVLGAQDSFPLQRMSQAQILRVPGWSTSALRSRAYSQAGTCILEPRPLARDSSCYSERRWSVTLCLCQCWLLAGHWLSTQERACNSPTGTLLHPLCSQFLAGGLCHSAYNLVTNSPFEGEAG